MKKRTLSTIVISAILGGTIAYFVKKYVKPIYVVAKQWDDEHDLINTSKSDDCIVISSLRNHYLKTPNGDNFLIVANTAIDSKYPAWIKDTFSEIYTQRSEGILPSTQALFAAKYLTIESKLSHKEKRDLQVLGIALFERPIVLSQEQANMVKEKMISIINKVSKK